MDMINNPLVLSALHLCTMEKNDEDDPDFFCQEFDGRRHFVLTPRQQSMAALLTLTNARRLHSTHAPGLRRTITASLIDTTDNEVIHTRTKQVYLPKGKTSDTYCMIFPFSFDKINPDHGYMVRVTENKHHQLLGEERFRLFDPTRCGEHPHAWYKAVKGGISHAAGDQLYTAIDTNENEYYKVQFVFEPDFKEMPRILPEVEVRIYFPDGSMEAHFCTPEKTSYEFDEYCASMPFFMNRDRRGVCYAEVICMDYGFAGFTFSTCMRGEYGGRDHGQLRVLDVYSLDAATERFGREQAETGNDIEAEDDDFGENEDEDTDADTPCKGWTDEDFERALDEFIASETKKKGSIIQGMTKKNDRQADTPAAAPETRPLAKALDRLTGLKSVKEKLNTYEKVVRFNKMRRENGLPVTDAPLHAMFLGSPGTGKTTVAKLMGEMLAQTGMLSKGHVVVKERATLLGPNYSMEETNTLEAIEEAQGGILLIDEAYQLYQPNDPRDPGKFVIETLMTAMADETKRDWMLILAGYPEEMKRMFDMNPGFKSRIPDSNIYVFDDFTETELLEIAENYLAGQQFSLTPEAHEALQMRLKTDYARRDKNFGNARYMMNMIQTEILPAMAVRVMTAEATDTNCLSVIQAADIPQPVQTIVKGRPRIGFCA